MADNPEAELRLQLAEQAEELAGLREAVSTLTEILVGRGPTPARTIHLGVYEDKRAVVGPAIDCAALLPLCRARCCSFSVPLSRQDLEEARLRFDVDQPYLLRRADDGYCVHLERGAGGCTAYADRPGPCREYDCRADPRVWTDFERRLAAPVRAVVMSAKLL